MPDNVFWEIEGLHLNVYAGQVRRDLCKDILPQERFWCLLMFDYRPGSARQISNRNATSELVLEKG
jgi:hypothetical protein